MNESANSHETSGTSFAAELLHDAPCGFLVTDTKERVLYANNTLGHWLGQDPCAIEAGLTIKDILTRESHLLFQTHIGPTIQLQGFAREILCKLRVKKRNEPLSVMMNAVHRPQVGDLPARIDFAFFDATERTTFEQRLRERQEEAEELAAIVRNAKVGIFRCDEQGRVKRLNGAAAQMLGIEPGHLPDEPIDRLLVLDGDQNDWFANAIRASETDGTFEASRSDKHYSISIGEIANPQEPYAKKEYSVLLRDVSARVLAEQRTELLVGELNHRIKNVFSVVMGLIRQSLPNTLAERDKLLDRLQSMANSHDILTKNYWKNASVQDIFAPIKAQAGDNQSVVIDGPDFRLMPNQFKALSMAAHELATNARKYGALLSDTGIVEISWAVEETDKKTIEFQWRESGGPTVVVPEKTGFGSAMIKRSLAAEFNGSAQVIYRPEGLEFMFRGEIES